MTITAPDSRTTDSPESPPQVTVNGRLCSLDGVLANTTALNWLRDIGLTGAKEGCAEGECGACSVLVARPDYHDAETRTQWTAINACLIPAATLDGQEVVTVRGPRHPRGPPPGAAGDGGPRRVPVRLLHAGVRLQHGGRVLPGRPRRQPGGVLRRRRDPGLRRPRGVRARPQRLRPALPLREPLPLHRLPADPGRRLRPGYAPRGRRLRGPPRVAPATGPAHPDRRAGRRVRPADQPVRGHPPPRRPSGRGARGRLDRLGRRGQHPGHPRPLRHRRRPAPRAARLRPRRGLGRARRRADAHRDRTPPGRSDPAAGPRVSRSSPRG